jgi:hypothetical protein
MGSSCHVNNSVARELADWLTLILLLSIWYSRSNRALPTCRFYMASVRFEVDCQETTSTLLLSGGTVCCFCRSIAYFRVRSIIVFSVDGHSKPSIVTTTPRNWSSLRIATFFCSSTDSRIGGLRVIYLYQGEKPAIHKVGFCLKIQKKKIDITKTPIHLAIDLWLYRSLS